MTRVEFHALEYHADTSLERHAFEFEGDEERGWRVLRDGAQHLELGPGYRLLRTESCGVCSTDLARHHLPFPLPQITGHELVARDERGRACVVEINASHRARGREEEAHGCAFCSAGLPTHCPERIVLGIHDLPGGFGPYVLAPVEAVIAVPDALPLSTAVLVEPFAAALHAVTTLFPEEGPARGDVKRVAVLGPRRLGQLVVAALAAWRARQGLGFEILALSRHAELLRLASELGADRGERLDANPGPRGASTIDTVAEVVVDTTGSPAGLQLAVGLAAQEVHLKSTHGRPAAGLEHLTELVVDELSIGPLDPTASAPEEAIAWMSSSFPPGELTRDARVEVGSDAEELLARFEQGPPSRAGLPRADRAVVDSARCLDAALRPRAGAEDSLVRPRGRIELTPDADVSGSPLLEAVRRRGLRLTSSRCGDFHRALELLAADETLRDLGRRFVTHRFGSARLGEALETARRPECIKAVVSFDGEVRP